MIIDNMVVYEGRQFKPVSEQFFGLFLYFYWFHLINLLLKFLLVVDLFDLDLFKYIFERFL